MRIRLVAPALLAVAFGCSGSKPGGGGGDGGTAGTGTQAGAAGATGAGDAGTTGTGGRGGTGGTGGTGGSGGIAGSGGSGGTGGSGGIAGSGGSGGAGGTAGSGGIGTGGSVGAGGASGAAGTGWINLAAFPSCLRDLFAMCPREGACLSDPASGRTCFASGVRTGRTWGPSCAQNDGGRPSSLSTTETRKADGSLCYTKTSSCYCDAACEAGTSVWTNGAGEEVATETYTYSSRTISCSGTSDSTTRSCGGGCADPDYPVLDCSVGTCP